MNSFTFSVIIPHNGDITENDPLLPTLASIADQEEVTIEILVQHGGGISGLWGKLSRLLNLSTKKEKITLRVIEEKSPSVEEALAVAVKRATGTWIGFLNPGEQLLPGALTSLQSALEAHSKIDLFLTGSIASIANKIAVTPSVLPSVSYLTNIQPPLPSHSFFCRASLLRNEFLLQPDYQHQMITEWFLRLLNSEKKIKALSVVTTFAPCSEKTNASLLPKPTGILTFLKPWHQWCHEAAVRQAKKSIKLPTTISIYHNASLSQRTSLS